jgi:hypothetical protein
MLKLLVRAVALGVALLAAPVLSQESAPSALSSGAHLGDGVLPAAYAELEAATSVVIVHFSTMANANSRTEDVFGAGEDPDLVALRMTVANSKTAVAALEAQGLNSQDVVAMKATHDGAVQLYVNDL